MKKILLSLLVLMAIAFSSCRPSSPSVYRGMPKTYATAYTTMYGHCYDSIAAAVLTLDLYSDGLELTKEKGIQGTGYNLCLSDVLVPDSLLEEGEYRSTDTAEPFTFLPGRSYEGYPHGAYILNIEENKVKSIQVVDSGLFVYRNDSLLFTLYYRNAYGSKVTYTCSYAGALIPFSK
jgi:hypothetical protein